MASRGHIKISLQDTLLDTPKLHGNLLQLESALAPFRDYVTLLRDTLQACHLHQEKVGEGVRALANLLSSIDSEIGEKTPSNAFAQLARYQTELHSCHEMLTSQLQNSVVNRVSALLEEDMDNIQSLKETYESSRLEHENAMAKFSRTSKRRDSEKTRFEANADLYVARKKFYQCSLDYCSELNGFQIKKKVALLEPILTFMHAQMGYFKACHEIMNTDFQQLLTNLNTDLQSYHKDYEKEVRELNQQKMELELQFPSLCLPDPDLSDPFTEFPTANTELMSKYGYLYLRIQKSGLAAKWERTFFFTKNGYLYTQSLHKSAEALLHLRDSEAFTSDCDDRRYVMQISHHALKKPVFLQAESDTQRAEWISVINNNSARKMQHSMGGQSSDATRLRTRLYDSLERERIRSWASKELQQESAISSSSTLTKEKSPSILKVTPPSFGGKRSKSPLRSGPKTSQTGGVSGEAKLSQKGVLPGRSKKSTSVPTLPQASSISKLADVESWVDSTTAVTASVPPPRPLRPPTTSSSQTKPSSQPSQNSGPMLEPVKFSVKYLGQKEVQDPKSSATITVTIRGVMTARAVKKVKPAHSMELAITLKKITLTETPSSKAIGWFLLKDILNYAAHPEDEKLFGVICRMAEPDKKYVCHVMQAEHSGAEVCMAITKAIQTVWKMIQNKDGNQKSSAEVTPPLPAKPQGPPIRPPPPVAPYSGTLSSLLGSYNPVPAGLTTRHHQTAPATLQHIQDPSLPVPQSSSGSNLTNFSPQVLCGPGEESGVAGSGIITSLPPSLPESSSTSAESLSLGSRPDEEGAPIMFANIVEEEDLPLISFDQGTHGETATNTAALDGYVTSNTGSGNRDFSTPSPSEGISSTVPETGMLSSGYMSAPQLSSVSPSPSPTSLPTVVSTKQLTLPLKSVTKSSPSPPPLQQTSTPSPTPPSPAKSSSPPPVPPNPTRYDSVKQTATPTPTPSAANQKDAASSGTVAARSAADSLAQALGIETIPPESSDKNKATTVTSSTATTTSLAEEFGFDTTADDIDIENLIASMDPTYRPGEKYPHSNTASASTSEYVTSNPMQADANDFTDWTKF